jgi:hypothetical protein
MDVISSTAFGLDINKDKELNKDFVSYAKKTITTNLQRCEYRSNVEYNGANTGQM